MARIAANAAGMPYAFVATARAGCGWHGLEDAPELLGGLERAFEDAQVWTSDLSIGGGLASLPTGPGFVKHWPVDSHSGRRVGYVVVADLVARQPPSHEQEVAVEDVATLLAETLRRACQQSKLAEMAEQAARAEAILRQVSDSRSCEEALARMLSGLCEHHDAAVGRIWRLAPDETLHEVSRFVDSRRRAELYYGLELKEAARVGNSHIAASIQQNRAQALRYSSIEKPEQYLRLGMAIASGLQCQISYPIWLQDQRFGVTMVFTKDREDLDEVISDIASLENTIRPALFRKVTEDQIRFLAHHDELTQLGNRAAFNERLTEAVATAVRGAGAGGQGLALLYLDLDGFKAVNDTRGHDVGDKVLAVVAGRLRASVREGDLVARIGGDEFAIIHPAAGQSHAATQLARRLLQTIQQPIEIDGTATLVGLSIGIALCPSDGETPDVLQRSADAALYEAKQAGRNTFHLFEPRMAMLQQERLLIERDLKEAVEREEFTLHYQPIVAAEGLAVRGLEALLRWTHRTRGPLSPAKFVPLAEASGLILPLGGWVLESACRTAAGWAEPLFLSVNLSPLQFRQDGLTRQIEAVLSRTGLAASRLDLEVTEGVLLEGSERVMRTMHELREMGVRMTLDDFGTAYASLSYLRRFPFDRLKIDRLFVEGIGRDDATTAIVEAILSLSARLRLTVVAEGVETEAELGQLRAMGCGLVQGFLTGRPVPEAEAAVLAGGERQAPGVG